MVAQGSALATPLGQVGASSSRVLASGRSVGRAARHHRVDHGQVRARAAIRVEPIPRARGVGEDDPSHDVVGVRRVDPQIDELAAIRRIGRVRGGRSPRGLLRAGGKRRPHVHRDRHRRRVPPRGLRPLGDLRRRGGDSLGGAPVEDDAVGDRAGEACRLRPEGRDPDLRRVRERGGPVATGAPSTMPVPPANARRRASTVEPSLVERARVPRARSRARAGAALPTAPAPWPPPSRAAPAIVPGAARRRSPAGADRSRPPGPSGPPACLGRPPPAGRALGSRPPRRRARARRDRPTDRGRAARIRSRRVGVRARSCSDGARAMEQVTFTTDDGARLEGELRLPEDAPRGIGGAVPPPPAARRIEGPPLAVGDPQRTCGRASDSPCSASTSAA